MKIVGNFNEIRVLKSQCEKNARCIYCVLLPFCQLKSQQSIDYSTDYWVVNTVNTVNTTYNTIGGSTTNINSTANTVSISAGIEKCKERSPLNLFELTTIPTILITKEGEVDDIKQKSEEHNVQLGENSDR